jgi:hypothetical protein
MLLDSMISSKEKNKMDNEISSDKIDTIFGKSALKEKIHPCSICGLNYSKDVCYICKKDICLLHGIKGKSGTICHKCSDRFEIEL